LAICDVEGGCVFYCYSPFSCGVIVGDLFGGFDGLFGGFVVWWIRFFR